VEKADFTDVICALQKTDYYLKAGRCKILISSCAKFKDNKRNDDGWMTTDDFQENPDILLSF
jgi:hypothetical protein